MVLKYLLMGHHLIPGVSGMSGRLCNLLGRGHSESCQPAAGSGSVLSCSHPAEHLPEHCSLHQEGAWMEWER